MGMEAVEASRCRALRALVVVTLLALGGVAQAQEAQSRDEGVAKGLFQAGKAAYEQARYEEALEYFERAYEQSKRPLLLYNIGQAADRLRKDERALEAFKLFIELAPNEPERATVEGRIRALEQAVAARKEREAPAQAETSIAPSAATLPADTNANAVDSAIDDGAMPDDRAEPSLWSQWWLWAGVGVLVAGGVTAALILSSGEDDPKKPVPGELGGVVQTLRVPLP
jgi:tetratricopeptide (TPR) repeat protein